MIALIATLGLALFVLALLGAVAFVVRGSASVRRPNDLPDRPFVPTEIDAPLHRLRHYAEGAAEIDLDGDDLAPPRHRAKQGKPLHRIKRVKRSGRSGSKAAKRAAGSVAALLFALALALAPLPDAPATAQHPHLTRSPRSHHGADADLWNARAAVGELGWRAPDDAYAAIVEVHVRRAHLTGTTTAFMARRYSAAIRRPPRHRAWVRELHARESAPPSWPPHLDGSWWEYAQRFGAIRDVVREVLRGEREPACPAAEHYGSVELDGTPTGFVEVCRWRAGRHHQGFYARASRVMRAMERTGDES